MTITDVLGNEIGYIPIVLQEGGESVPITFRVIPEDTGDVLRAESSPVVSLLGRLSGGDWFDLTAPFSLSPYLGTFVLVEVKAVAAPDVPGLTRVYLQLGVVSSRPANWFF